jgi:hypothetical protein
MDRRGRSRSTDYGRSPSAEGEPTNGDPNLLFFTAGIDEEAHGPFGKLTPIDCTRDGDFQLTSDASEA